MQEKYLTKRLNEKREERVFVVNDVFCYGLFKNLTKLVKKKREEKVF
jgi:hypothetical protein